MSNEFAIQLAYVLEDSKFGRAIHRKQVMQAHPNLNMVRSKPCFSGTNPALTPVDPKGRELEAHIYRFFGQDLKSFDIAIAVQILNGLGVYHVYSTAPKPQLIGRIRMERTQRYDIPVARMYRIAA